MESITAFSCPANPFTVFTRLGIRSARRCSATSTCAQAPLMASSWTASSLRTETNFPANMSPPSSRTPNTISSTFMMVASLFKAIDRVDDHRDFLQVGPYYGRRIQVLGFDFVLAQMEQLFEGRCVDPEHEPRLVDHLPLVHLRFPPMQHQRVPEQHAEGGNGIRQQLAQQLLFRQDSGRLLAQAQHLGSQLVLHLRAIKRIV